jgi:hypothetical protein
VLILYSTIDDVKVGSLGFATSSGMPQPPDRRGHVSFDTALQTDKDNFSRFYLIDGVNSG